MSTHTPIVRQFFESDSYLVRNPIVAVRARLVADVLSDLRGGRVLDLGSGDGSVSRPLLAAGNDVTLVDFSEAMLRRARQAAPAETAGMVKYVQADVMSWPPGETYDAVLCIGLLAHVTSPVELVERVAAATRERGLCIMQITDGRRPLGWWLTRYGRLRQREGYRLNEMTGPGLIALGATYGLIPVAARRYGFLLPPIGRLPYRWHSWVENRFASGWLANAGAELLLVFRREE
jgi:SAM-dependent methyltransferase